MSLTSVLLQVEGWLDNPCKRITIFQTRDPFVSSSHDVQLEVIASGEITLETNDKLDNKALSALGFGEPGELF